MYYLSTKLAHYIVKNKDYSNEDLEFYQYCIQVGIEMILCAVIPLSIAMFLHMFFEYLLFFIIFVTLRSYIGGIHLESFFKCFCYSIMIQIGILLFSQKYILSLYYAWYIIIVCYLIIYILAPIDYTERILDIEEKHYFRKILKRNMSIVFILAVCFSIVGSCKYVSLIAYTILLVLVLALIGFLVFRIDKKRLSNY